ncbi:MAG: ABC transporter permease [Anaerolineae bacterium]|nr:ABC transporter permease [Anaerolineae bacterium]
MNWLRGTLQELRKYPTAMLGLVVILALVLISAYALITIPYSEAIRLWRGGEEVVRDYPKNARPVWTNYFTRTKLARSYILDSREEDGEAIMRVTEPESSFAQKEETIIFSIDFEYDTFPQELILYLNGRYSEKQPHVSVTWETPDGREIRIGELSAGRNETYRFNADQRLERRLRGVKPEIGLFAVPESDPPVPLEGTYRLKVNSLLFDADDGLDARFVVYGQVYGLAGTDHRRRDLMVPLLWGTPVALAFGLLAAVGSTLTTMIIAAVGVWYGGAVDGAIQRITEVNLILPVLPILIMVGTFYSRSIWVILGVVILLGIFGAGIKTFRAIFLQVKESPYIEAAQSYGAGSWRIIMVYLVPRIVPLLIPQLVVLIPGFVFLEASLTVLGLGDPVLPTWGKIINDANNQGALFNGYYYWVLQPAALLMLTGLGFSMVGFALDRIFNPRLRGV